MKIFRIIATDGPYIKSKYILAKNKKQAKEWVSSYVVFSNYLIDTIQVEDVKAFWDTLSESEQDQFKKALVNNFFNKEICDE